MGIFDPPAVSIRKRIPRTAHTTYNAVASQVAGHIPEQLTGTQKGLVLGFVMAAWALGEVRVQNISLTEKDRSYVQNMGMNCSRALGGMSPIAIDMVEHYIDHGLIAAME